MKEIRALTGLRGVAAILVFFAHLGEILPSRGITLHVPTIIDRLFPNGAREVDIFFVLSGFVLALIYRQWFADSVTKKSYGKFLRRRFARIYPLHAAMLVMVILLVFAAHLFHAQIMNGLGRFDVATLPVYFLLMQAWGFLGNHTGEWNPPSWSVSIEALAYLIFPFFIFVSSRFEKNSPWKVFAVLTCCGILLNLSTPWGLGGYPAIARGLSQFMLGCATAAFFGSPLAARLQTSWGSFLALAALLICFALTPDSGFQVGLFTAPLLLALCGNNWVCRLFDNRPIFFLGEISYSIYLGHFLFSAISYRLVSTAWMGSGTLQLITGLCLITVFVLAASTVTYFAIERPGRALLRGRTPANSAPKVETEPRTSAESGFKP
jgi:peptidoglycan/LPS O-acetylase OafA/YrhL